MVDSIFSTLLILYLKQAKKNKGPTRDEVMAKMEAVLNDLLEHKSTNEAAEAWKENNWLPSKMTQTAVNHYFKLFLAKEEATERRLAYDLIRQLVQDQAINPNHVLEALNKTGGESGNCAEALARCFGDKIVSFKELCEVCNSDSNRKQFFPALKQIEAECGQEELKKLFDEAVDKNKLKIGEYCDGSCGEDVAAALDRHDLGFLLPMLKIEAEMSGVLNSAEPRVSPADFSAWIHEHVDAKFHSQNGFIMALFTSVMKMIAASKEDEKETLSKFVGVLREFVKDSATLQLTAVYALQVFCHDLGFPKGMLLRSFVNFYEMDVMDEQAFLKWKEDVNDTYPGKGNALFQVNLQQPALELAFVVVIWTSRPA